MVWVLRSGSHWCEYWERQNAQGGLTYELTAANVEKIHPLIDSTKSYPDIPILFHPDDAYPNNIPKKLFETTYLKCYWILDLFN
jgi:hypothetical protein